MIVPPIVAAVETVLIGLIEVWAIEYSLGVCRGQTRHAAGDVRRAFAALGLADLADLTPTAVAGYLAGLRKLGRSASTVRNAASNLSRFADWAVQRGYMPANPVAGIKRPPPDERCPVWLTEAEALQALAIARETGGWPEVALCLATGMRISELQRLKWLDVDFKARVLLVRRAKGRRPRAVALNALALAALDEQHACTAKLAFVFPARQTYRGGWRWRDRRRCYESFRHLLLPIKAAIPKFELRPGRAVGRSYHMFRHSFGAAMAGAHVDTRYIQETMGHSDIKTTEIYTHLAGGYDPAIEAAAFGQRPIPESGIQNPDFSSRRPPGSPIQ